jgi:hypothetical protein
MANPKEKRTLQDLWNIPFRGLVPGGLNDQKDNPALPKNTQTPDPPVMVDAELECPDSSLTVIEEPLAIPVIITDDMSHIVGTVRRYFHAFQIQVGAVQTVQLLGQDTSRRRALIRNVGPGSVFLGGTESVGRSGYSLFQTTVDPPLEVITTEEIWALQDVGQSSTATVHILVEFDK